MAPARRKAGHNSGSPAKANGTTPHVTIGSPQPHIAKESGDVTGQANMLRMAPLRIPWQRRMQTFAVLFAIGLMFAYFVAMAWLILAPTAIRYGSWWFVGAACVWTYIIDRKTATHGGRRFPILSKFPLWRYLRDYYPATLVVSQKLDPRRKYVFGLHPHGIIGAGCVANLILNGDTPQKAIGVEFRVLTVTFHFAFPLWRDFIMGLGFVSASRSSAEAVLKQGKSCMIVVGGAKEALDARPGVVDLTLGVRRGFVSLALQHGAHLVPVFTFGENELWDQVPNPEGSWLRAFQKWCIRVFGFSTPIVYGRGIFNYGIGILPHRRELTTIVGPPLVLPHIANPTDAQVEHYHELYVQALERLYNQHRGRYEKPMDSHARPIPSTGLRIVQ